MMSKILGVAVFLMFSISCSAQDDFRYKCPNGHSILPVNCLSEMRILNVNRQLTNAKRHQLCRLFIKSYLVTIRRYKQDYLLEADVPIYQLFRANFPGISKAEGEGGVFLENIYKFIKAMPEYRRDIKVMSR